MKIIIAGGTANAEYIVSLYKKRGNSLIVINDNREETAKMVERYEVVGIVGRPYRANVLEKANVYAADLFLALSDSDTDNFASCILAKTCFSVKKCICVVANPKNVSLFEKLGIDSVVSSTYTLGQSIESATADEGIFHTVSFENGKAQMIEMTVLSDYRIAGKTLAECKFPKYCSIALVIRGDEVIIPSGSVKLEAKDKLLIMCADEYKTKVASFIKKED